MWDEQHILGQVLAALTEFEAHCNAADAVQGLDALEELELHPLIASGLTQGDSAFDAYREVHYPTPPSRRAKRTDRERCDLVLTARDGGPPSDIVAHNVSEDDRAQTLFSGGTPPAPVGTPHGECLWLEVKIVKQYAYVDGVPGPNRTYASQFVRAISKDLRKLTEDDRILHGAVLLVLFTSDSAIAEHDLMIALHRVLDRGLLFRSPLQASLRITDRIGNGLCTLVWVGKISP